MKMSKQNSRILIILDIIVKVPPTISIIYYVSGVTSTKKETEERAIPTTKHNFAKKFIKGIYKCSLNFYDSFSFLWIIPITYD